MNRTLYIVFIVAACLLAACTKHMVNPEQSVSDASRSYIFFESKVNSSVDTKATLITSNSLPTDGNAKFGVIGYYGSTSVFANHANGIAQVSVGTDGICRYSNLAAWQNSDPAADIKHNFYAFYPYNINEDVKINGGNPYVEYMQPATEDAMIDILTAHTSTSRVSGVGLEFHHRLSALELCIENTQTEGYGSTGITSNPSITITDVNIEFIQYPVGGNIFINEVNAIVPSTDVADYKYDLLSTNTVLRSQSADSDNSKWTSSPLLLLPISGLKYKVTITYLDHNNQDYVFDSGVKTAETSFSGGNSYLLTIKKGNATDVLSVGWHIEGIDSNQVEGCWSDKDVPHQFN